MSAPNAWRREVGFFLRERGSLLWIVVALVLASYAVATGLGEVAAQRAELANLQTADQIERARAIEAHGDWGSSAYYTFHLTWDPPAPLSFAALGHRDALPWKHRIRMLALEGQIHERDVANPTFALLGRFDYAFVVSLLLPLFLILILHDLRASERDAGRFELLEATAGSSVALFRTRAWLRSGALTVAVLLPLLLAGVINHVALGTLSLATLAVLAYAAFWTLVCQRLARLQQSGPVIFCALLGVWLLLAIVVPAAGRTIVERAVPVPSLGEIALTQREAVNDAWDLPKTATFDPFIERHPEWRDYTAFDSQFEWKWYYAFQQVGDQTAEPLALAYRDGLQRRDALAGWLAVVAPPALIERVLQRLGETDLAAALDYEADVRRFHANLRNYYYPL
ncbi:MAG: DUF3526 domain-containing protein, partial [Pseudomonadota bacterium]